MSLAPTMGAPGPRLSSFLPAIKCSNCGEEIEIAAMGEHTCGHAAAQHATFEDHSMDMGNPYALGSSSPPRHEIIPMPSMPMIPDLFESEPSVPEPYMRNQTETLPSSPDSNVRLPRAPLPTINSEAVNKPFLAPKFDSPMSPTISVRSVGSSGGKPGMPRSVTSPMPRLYNLHPPSPELSANIDCAFPPFPAPISGNSRPSTSNGRRTPVDREPVRRPSKLDLGLMPMKGSSTMEPKSPRLNGGESILERMNTLKSGPFNAKKSKSSSGDSKPGSSWFGRRRPSETPVDKSQVQLSQESIPEAIHLESENSFPERKFMSPRPERPTTGEMFQPRFLDQFSAEPSTMLTTSPSPLQVSSSLSELERSRTYPLQDDDHRENLEAEPLTKVKSESALPSSDIPPPTLPKLTPSKPPSLPPDDTIPTYDDDTERMRVDHRMHDAPPVPKSLQRRRQESINAPSESGYSTVSSTYSANNSTSSRRPSQVTSAASSVETFSPLGYNSHKYVDEEPMRAQDPKVKTQDRNMFTEQEALIKTPPPNFARIAPRRTMSSSSDHVVTMPLESPMDPALKSQAGIASIIAPVEISPSKAVPTQTNGLPRPTRRGPVAPAPPLTIPGRPRLPGPPIQGSQQPTRRNLNEGPQGSFNNMGHLSRMQPSNSVLSPMTPIDPQARPSSRRGNGPKAICRGCGQAIEGKSVKAADGRLTGRWHKACFVCRTCREPFTTADFYVINNEPYCEQHYHEHNGSLCAGCHRGIEGQYIETSSATRPGLTDMKFHPRCFTCWECRSVLADDYFEINGKVFCERHAHAAMRAQARTVGGGGGINGSMQFNSRSLAAERRTTRLMMMA